MKKQSKTHTLRSRLFRILPSSFQTSMVRLLARHHIANEPVGFPPRLDNISSAVIVLPESLFEAIHQIDNLMALRATLTHAQIFYLCERNVAGFFQSMSSAVTIVEYDRDERFLFSASFAQCAATVIAQEPQIAILLEKEPDLSLLSFMSRTGARYRIGYEGSGEFPFVNLHVRPIDAVTYLPEANSSLARCLGAPPQKPVRWMASKEAREGLGQFLGEVGFAPSARLIGVEGHHFHSRFGEAWTAQLLSRLGEIPDHVLYCIPERNADEAALAWLKAHGLAIIPPMRLPRLTALIHRSETLVTGNTVNFQLARLLDRPAIGLFDRACMDKFFKPTAAARGIAYERQPTEESAESVVTCVRELSKG